MQELMVTKDQRDEMIESLTWRARQVEARNAELWADNRELSAHIQSVEFCKSERDVAQIAECREVLSERFDVLQKIAAELGMLGKAHDTLPGAVAELKARIVSQDERLNIYSREVGELHHSLDAVSRMVKPALDAAKECGWEPGKPLADFVRGLSGRDTALLMLRGIFARLQDPLGLQPLSGNPTGSDVRALEKAACDLSNRLHELEAKLAAMPEPVVIDTGLATRVVNAYVRYKRSRPSTVSEQDMLAALREVLGDRVAVQVERVADRDLMAMRERADVAEVEVSRLQTLLDATSGQEERAKELRAENERLKARVGELELIESNLFGMQVRYCIEGDYCEDGVHPVEVRIQTQQRVIAELQKKLAESEAALEQERVRLAGCGAAAKGYDDGCKKGDYGWSASFGDVMELRQRWLESEAARKAAEATLRDVEGRCTIFLNPYQYERLLEIIRPKNVNAPKNLEGSRVKAEPSDPSVPYGWEHASPADKLRPNDRHALRQVEPAFTPEHARKLEAMWRAFEEFAKRSLVDWRGVPAEIVKACASEVSNG